MRRAGAAAAALAAAVLGPGAAAGETHGPGAERRPPVMSKPDWASPSITYDLAGGTAPAPAGAPSRRRHPLRARPSAHYVTVHLFDQRPDGTRCLRLVTRAYPSALAAATAQQAENVLAALAAADWPRCDTPAVTPAAERAAAYWRVAGEDLLPRPAPSIAPGWMLAGKRAYLEAGTVPSVTFQHPTPAGLLTIEATGPSVVVDWGDGSGPDGPHHGAGGPWPNGTITHVWSHSGTYDVRVRQRWTAWWSLAGETSGALEPITTEGVIEDFQVRQLQAVRNR